MIGRFTSTDAYAEQYVALSLYQYGALNPAKNMDINGDSIKVTAITTIGGFWGVPKMKIASNLYFEGSTAYYADGTVYNGNDAFVADISKSLASLSAYEVGEELVNYLERSKKNSVTLFNRSINKTDDVAGSYVLWNPNLKAGPPDQSGTTPQRDVFISLGHEFAHVENIWKKTVQPGIWFSGLDDNGDLQEIPNKEKYATFRENQIRAEHGLPLRTYYSPDGQGGVNGLSSILTGKGINRFYRTVDPPITAKSVLTIPPATIPLRPIKP